MVSLTIQKSENLTMMKLRFFIIHAASLAIFFIHFEPSLIILTLTTFFFRIFGLEAGYHRYFAHRSFKTSRIFQFILALLGAAGGFRGPLWWTLYHRLHHKYADTKMDIHSPSHTSLWYAHAGWFFNKDILDTDLSKVKDLAQYPELVQLNKYHFLMAPLQIIFLYCLGHYTHIMGEHVGGWQCVIYGYFFSTMLVLHTIFMINSIAHSDGFGGYRRFQTKDKTQNHGWLSILSMGGSWHNNHHRYPSAARAGFYKEEIDLTYYILKILSKLAIVWDLREVPSTVLEEGHRTKGK